MEEIISLKNVSCQIGCHYLLYDINWQIKKGEHWAVFGLNGSGKTTLLSIIAGYQSYSTGEVRIFGEKINNDNIIAARQRIGWVSSSFFDKYYTKESVLDIVLSGKCGTLGVNKSIVLADVLLAKELLAALNLSDKVNYTFDMLSKGERQNVLIARALINDPDILIFDEPCTGLDVYNRSCLFSTIEDLSGRKDLSIIYVTHYTEEIMPLFDRLLLLKNGHIFAMGSTKELMTKQYLENFLGIETQFFSDEDACYRLKLKTVSEIAKLLK